VFVNKHLIGQHGQVTRCRLFIVWHFLMLRHDQQAVELSASFIVIDSELFTKHLNLDIVCETQRLRPNLLTDKSTYDSASSHKSSSSK